MNGPGPISNGMYVFHLPGLNKYKDFVVYENIFSKDECMAVRELGFTRPPGEATIINEQGHNIVKENIRVSKARWIDWNVECDWIFKKLESTLVECNNEVYKFDLSGFYEPLQFTEYGVGGYYSWHKDMSNGKYSMRKLSITLQLSSKEEYEGGDMEFFNHYGVPIPKKIGTVVIFPSYVPHRVMPLTKGTRFSLVAWSSGPHFR